MEIGRGLWKLNCLLLDDEEVVGRFVSLFRTLEDKKSDFQDLLEWWDWVKNHLASFFKKVGVKKARKKREAGRRLIERVHFLYLCKRLGL